MPTQHFTVRIHLDGLKGELTRTLQSTILLVAAGLQNLDLINPHSLELPVSIKMILDPNLQWSKEEIGRYYSEWMLSNGFRDAIEAVGGFLEESHRVLSIWDLVGVRTGSSKISGKQWNTEIVAGGRKFHALGLPNKLDHLRSSHEVISDHDLVSHVLSINKARNCLVHRKGIVTEQDVSDTVDKLTVSWRRLSLFVQDEDGDRPLQIGQTIEKGETVCVRHEDSKKSFACGEIIHFNPSEFSEICWSLFLFGEDLVGKMNALGISKGVVRSAAAAPE